MMTIALSVYEWTKQRTLLFLCSMSPRWIQQILVVMAEIRYILPAIEYIFIFSSTKVNNEGKSIRLFTFCLQVKYR